MHEENDEQEAYCFNLILEKTFFLLFYEINLIFSPEIKLFFHRFGLKENSIASVQLVEGKTSLSFIL